MRGQIIKEIRAVQVVCSFFLPLYTAKLKAARMRDQPPQLGESLNFVDNPVPIKYVEVI